MTDTDRILVGIGACTIAFLAFGAFILFMWLGSKLIKLYGDRTETADLLRRQLKEERETSSTLRQAIKEHKDACTCQPIIDGAYRDRLPNPLLDRLGVGTGPAFKAALGKRSNPPPIKVPSEPPLRGRD